MLTNLDYKIEENFEDYDYQVGGSLPMDAPTYVVREADRELDKALKLAQFCYILNSRQTGKSSLQVRSMKRLQAEGINCTAIDISAIGNHNITIEQWYAGFIYTLASNLNLLDRLSLIRWWKERKHLSPVARFAEFVREIMLEKIQGNIVIFLDEIDNITAFDFCMDDFFILLESFYTKRVDYPEFKRLAFVLVGCATEDELIQNKQFDALKIWQKIDLYGFKESETKPLLTGLKKKSNNPKKILREILAWTNGQPFLTQKICKMIRSEKKIIAADRAGECLENLVKTRIIENWEERDEPEHLKTIRNRLLKNTTEPREVFAIYQQILAEKKVIANNSKAVRELLLSGIAIERQGNLIIKNRIYQKIFDRPWLEKTIRQIA